MIVVGFGGEGKAVACANNSLNAVTNAPFPSPEVESIEARAVRRAAPLSVDDDEEEEARAARRDWRFSSTVPILSLSLPFPLSLPPGTGKGTCVNTSCRLGVMNGFNPFVFGFVFVLFGWDWDWVDLGGRPIRRGGPR